MSAMTSGRQSAAGGGPTQPVETAGAAIGTTEAAGRRRATLREVWRIGKVRMAV